MNTRGQPVTEVAPVLDKFFLSNPSRSTPRRSTTKLVFGGEASHIINTSQAVLVSVIRLEYETENEKSKGDLNATLLSSQDTKTYREPTGMQAMRPRRFAAAQC